MKSLIMLGYDVKANKIRGKLFSIKKKLFGRGKVKKEVGDIELKISPRLAKYLSNKVIK